jgi:hypothetical protein
MTATVVTPTTAGVVTALASWQAGIRQSRRSSMILVFLSYAVVLSQVQASRSI